MSLIEQTQLPSQAIIDEIATLPKTNVSPTNLIGLSPPQIAQYAIDKLNGQMRINIGKASQDEKESIKAAKELDLADIQIHDSSLTVDKDGFSQEDRILRKIDQEVISGNIGQDAFKRFIGVLLQNEENHHLVIDEWNTFIVDHKESRNVDSPYETHHFPNVGLRKVSEGKDTLRDEVVIFVRGAMEKVRKEAVIIFENQEIMNHRSPKMNIEDNRLFAIGMAEFSNFARGGILYRYQNGQKALDDYRPRALAAEIIDEVTAEANIKD